MRLTYFGAHREGAKTPGHGIEKSPYHLRYSQRTRRTGTEPILPIYLPGPSYTIHELDEPQSPRIIVQPGIVSSQLSLDTPFSTPSRLSSPPPQTSGEESPGSPVINPDDDTIELHFPLINAPEPTPPGIPPPAPPALLPLAPILPMAARLPLRGSHGAPHYDGTLTHLNRFFEDIDLIYHCIQT